ncbi:MAG: hypothetical protein ABIP52_09230, partial [Cyclobacteriaceae bacterium]
MRYYFNIYFILGDYMAKELVSEKKLLDIINAIIASEFAKIQKKCSISALRRKTSNPNWEIHQFHTSVSNLSESKYSYALYKHAL